MNGLVLGFLGSFGDAFEFLFDNAWFVADKTGAAVRTTPFQVTTPAATGWSASLPVHGTRLLRVTPSATAAGYEAEGVTAA